MLIFNCRIKNREGKHKHCRASQAERPPGGAPVLDFGKWELLLTYKSVVPANNLKGCAGPGPELHKHLMN